MQKYKRFALSAVAVFALGSGTSNAMLIDRGGGFIYDTVLDVTWMQDALYAATAGASANGRLTYADAMAFASNTVVYDAVRDVYWDDWRLPQTINLPTSLGYDTTGTSSELAYMYYINLGYAPNTGHDPSLPVADLDQLQPLHQSDVPRLLVGDTGDASRHRLGVSLPLRVAGTRRHERPLARLAAARRRRQRSGAGARSR